MSNLKPGVQGVMTCAGAVCSHTGEGHAVSAIRSRAASATPSKWRDAFIGHVDTDGWIALDLFESGERVWAWHHADLSASVEVGQPVALHGVYNVLAIGRERASVLVTAAL
ncbi:MAG: hypothetical protein ABWY36_03145 [Leifsonia sp.]